MLLEQRESRAVEYHPDFVRVLFFNLVQNRWRVSADHVAIQSELDSLEVTLSVPANGREVEHRDKRQ